MSTSATTIASIHAREVLDSRGNPTVEAEVALVGGASEGQLCLLEPRPVPWKQSS